MADRKLTAEDLLAGLNDIRLPNEVAGGQLAEIFAAIGLGLLIALAISAVLPFITKRKTETNSETIGEQIERADKLPENERAVALLRLLKEQRPEAAQQISKTIYAPGGMPDISVLVTELQREDA